MSAEVPVVLALSQAEARAMLRLLSFAYQIARRRAVRAGTVDLKAQRNAAARVLDEAADKVRRALVLASGD